MHQVMINIIKDIKEPISYLPSTLLVALCMTMAVCVWKLFLCSAYREKMQSISLTSFLGHVVKEKWGFLLMLTYILVVLQYTIFSRTPGSREGVSLGLFATWSANPTSQAYFFENILMFIPFGMLLPMIHTCFWKWYHCVMLALGFSVGIEFVQFVTMRGFCQLDDVLTNIFGAWVGYLIVSHIYKVNLCGKRKDL